MHRNASLAFELLLRALLCRLRNVRERLGKLVIYIHTRMRAIQIFACYGFSTHFPRRNHLRCCFHIPTDSFIENFLPLHVLDQNISVISVDKSTLQKNHQPGFP